MQRLARSLALFAATLLASACADTHQAPDPAAPAVDAAATASATTAPWLARITPAGGPTAGGTSVTLMGDFGTNATVAWDGRRVASQALSASAIVLEAPPGDAGLRARVQVVSSAGDSSDMLRYTYDGVSPLAMVPDWGPTTGAVAITIQGANFEQGAEVVFDGKLLPTTRLSTTAVTALSPAGEGRVRVWVHDAGAVRDTLDFTYSAPAITGFSPQAGSTAGGTLITIVGQDFGFTPQVTVGGRAASIEQKSHTAIVARTPGGIAGPAPVMVTTAGQASNAVTYTYIAMPPAIVGISPTHGPAQGGNVVTITGAEFGTSAAVSFGGRMATNATVTNTQIVATAPSGQGTVSVTVTNAGGTSNPLPYTYDVGVPMVTSVSPATGPTAGGYPVTITGNNLGTGAVVRFGGVAVPPQSASYTQIVVTAPAGEGRVPVVVTTSGGSSDPLEFTYTPPLVASITPNSGPAAGGNTVTLMGSNFGLNPVVTFDGAVAPIHAHSHTMIGLIAPAGPPGRTAEVRVIVAGQPSNPVAYTWAPPVLAGMSPTHGPTAGGTTVTLTGANFGASPVVTFGAAAAQAVSWTQTAIVVRTPAGQGSAPVTVHAGGATSNSLQYDYDAPAISALTPTNGPTAGGTRITLTGTSFGTSGTVTVGGHPAMPVSWNHSQVVVNTPPGAAGDAMLVMTVSGKASNPMTFRYDPPPPVLTALTPASGPVAGGTRITLMGSNLGLRGTVVVGGAVATSVSWTQTQVVALTPAGAPGTASVVLTTSGMTSNRLAYTYECPTGTFAEGSRCVTPMQHLESLVEQLPPDARQVLAPHVARIAEKLAGNPKSDAACAQIIATGNQVDALERKGKISAAQAIEMRAALELIGGRAGCR